MDNLNDEDWTGCRFPNCGVRVLKVPAPREPLCFDHVAMIVNRANQADGLDREAAIADVRRRVMGLD